MLFTVSKDGVIYSQCFGSIGYKLAVDKALDSISSGIKIILILEKLIQLVLFSVFTLRFFIENNHNQS